MTPTIKEWIHPQYGRCVTDPAGPVTALVTIERGPRILSYSFSEGENILYTEAPPQNQTGFLSMEGTESRSLRNRRIPITRITNL